MQATATKPVLEEGVPGRDPGSFTLSRELVALERQSNPAAEAFRALRTHVMARHVEEGKRSLAICGPSAGVGTTFVAVNLAVALSQIGVKTLLVDGDLRTPSIGEFIRPAKPLVGLQQCLSDDGSDYASYIQPDILPELSILFAGGSPPNAQELLASDRFAELMSYCLRDYDMVIVDTPAANVCSDGNRISSVIGYSLVVARKDKSLVSDIRTLVSQLESDRARVVGTVLTEG
jgi:capsular exopolysaccharide synthesis family protein